MSNFPLRQPAGLLYPHLPQRVLLRLAWHRWLTGIGIRLMDSGHLDAAERLWRVTGLL